MVDKLHTPKVLEELSRSSAAGPRPAERRKHTALRRILVLLMLFAPLLAGLLFLGYQQWDLRLSVDRLAEEDQRLLEAVGASNLRVAELEAELSARLVTEMEAALARQVPTAAVDDAAIEALRREFRNRLDSLSRVTAELQYRLGDQSVEENPRWRLGEAEHLLRLANQHLQLTADTRATITLLESADRLLADLEGSRIPDVRQELERELRQLQAVEIVDSDGLYRRLGGLRETLGQLDIAGDLAGAYRQRLVDNQDSQQNTGSDASLLDTGLAFLGSVFVWRKWEDIPQTPRFPQEIVTITLNIDLMLEQAQLALLSQRGDLYHNSLQRAADLIRQYLVEVSDHAPRMLEELDSLSVARLSPELPDISRSLTLVRELAAGAGRGAGTAPR